MIIEIAAFSIEAALKAQKGGADRIELCSAPSEGGLTPSVATIELARKYVSIPIHVIIRPREGDFLYSEREYDVMLRDIDAAMNAGANGVVSGILNPDGTIDIKRMKTLLKAVGPLDFTFHRAFDMTREPFESMEILISLGVKRILTSGMKKTALEGISLIQGLIGEAKERISIMPGGGINAGNVGNFLSIPGLNEIHMSAAKIVRGKMQYKNLAISMGGNRNMDEYSSIFPDESLVRFMKKISG
jgi:copper homeostasis protein